MSIHRCENCPKRAAGTLSPGTRVFRIAASHPPVSEPGNSPARQCRSSARCYRDFFDEHPTISLKIDIATRETQLKHLENNDVEFVIKGATSGTDIRCSGVHGESSGDRGSHRSSTSQASINSCVAAGLGLGILSLHMLEPQLLTCRIAVLDVQKFPIIRHWQLVTRKGKKLSPSARAFMDFVIQKSHGDWPLKNLYKLAGTAYARG